MFTVVPAGDYRWHISCSDTDKERMKRMIGKHISEYLDVEICSFIEKALDSIVAKEV